MPNSPQSASWDYLLNEPPVPKSLSQCLIVGSPAGNTWTSSWVISLYIALCPTAQAPRSMAWSLGASHLTHMLCPYRLLHDSWVTCLESQSPAWIPSYLEVIILFLIAVVLFVHLLPPGSLILNHGLCEWSVSDFPPQRLQNPLCILITLLHGFLFCKPRV